MLHALPLRQIVHITLRLGEARLGKGARPRCIPARRGPQGQTLASRTHPAFTGQTRMADRRVAAAKKRRKTVPPRPKRVDGVRTAFIAVRCSVVERAAITERATESGLAVGAYLRNQALGTPGPRAVRKPPVEKAELARLLGWLGKLGSNVNQLARRFNSTGAFPGLPELLAIRREVGEMRAALMKALGRGD